MSPPATALFMEGSSKGSSAVGSSKGSSSAMGSAKGSSSAMGSAKGSSAAGSLKGSSAASSFKGSCSKKSSSALSSKGSKSGAGSSIACEGAKKVGSLDDIRNAGFEIGQMIVSDDYYTFYSAKSQNESILCKKIEMKKCSPRYVKNMTQNSLKIERFVGGDGGEPQCKHFIKVYDIFQVNS